MRSIEASKNNDPLSLQERVLAQAAYQRAGAAVVDYVLTGGPKVIRSVLESDTLTDALVDRFRDNPKESLGYMRQNLIAIGADRRLSKADREDRLKRYLDAYTSLTVKLDHAAFPADETIRTGVPEYIPDGFVDMGGYSSRDLLRRGGREQIRVDKAAIFSKHRDLLLGIFSHDWSGVDSTTQKKSITAKLLLEVYRTMTYDYDLADNGHKGSGDVINLHDMDKGVCRHLALKFQVLAQACGLTSRLVKCNVNGVRHAANAVRINYDWRLVDPTIPDYKEMADGQKYWRPGAYRIEREPRGGDRLAVTGRFSGDEYVYSIHNDMNWRLER